MEPSQHNEKPGSSALGIGLSMGIQVVVSVLLGAGIGQWVDERFGTQPWLVLCGTMAGIGVGLYHLIRETSRLEKRR